MTLEPIIIFLLIRHLKKNMQTFSPEPDWNKILKNSLYAAVALFIIQIVFKIPTIATWIWHLLFIVIVAAAFKLPEFTSAQPVIFAVLPFLALSILGDMIKLVSKSRYEEISGFFKLGFAIAITWMIAMLLRSGKQQKAIENERKKTREEEERNKFMAIQKTELELLVAERTSEIMNQKNELQATLTELKTTQKQLIQSEKMASLGELTAGIAHEIQNPLNFVNNFSEVNAELIDEMQQEINKSNFAEVAALAEDIKENEQKIIYHGKRADAIVKGMLQHSRSSSGVKEPTDINALADEYFRLAYHGLRAKDKTFNATLQTNFDKNINKINIVPQDIGRVLLNLFTNAFYSVTEASLRASAAQPDAASSNYKPTVSVSTKALLAAGGFSGVSIAVKDNGIGIPQEVIDKIYQPFFTTKPTGHGTGLGLSLSYDIIKTHGGDITVNTKEGEGAEFIIQLPAV